MKKRLTRIMVLLSLILIMLASTNPVTAGSASGFDGFTYTVRQGWKTVDSDVTVTSPGNNWTDGYLDIGVTSGGDAGDQFRLLSSGSLSVVGDAISWNGTRIGTIDPTYNGVNGQKLRINFSASLLNSDFETGDFTGWTVNTSFPGLPGDTPSGITQTASVQSSTVFQGSYAAELKITGGVTTDCGTAHGPQITSNVFYAQAGNTLSLRWNALDSGDDYDVYGYLVNASTGVEQELFYGRGDNTNGWNTLNATIGATVCPSGTCGMQFRFLAGTFDATCGRAVGSTMYIDGINVVTSVATDAAVDYIVEHFEYQNTSNSPNANKMYTLTMQDSSSSGSASASISISKASTTTTITSINPEPTVFGQNYTVQVSVAAQAPSIGTPDGTVNVNDGQGNSCVVTLSGGSGSCSLPSNSVGARSISAIYPGTALGYNTSADTDSHSVNKANTTTTITSDLPDPSVYGQDYTVHVDVNADAPSSATPTGSVSVSDGSNNCNINLVNGSGSCVLPSALAGNKTLTATYGSTTNLEGSTTTTAHLINKATTTTGLTRSVVDPVFGEPLHFVATVNAVAPGTITPTGPVQFYVDGEAFGGQAMLSGGTVTSQTTTALNAGEHTYHAVFEGDANNTASNSLPPVTFEIAPSVTTTTVTTSSPTSVYGQPIRLIATVEEELPSVVNPVGQVQFYFQNEAGERVALGSRVDLDSEGQAVSEELHTLLGEHLLVGSYTYSAEYLGNANSLPSESAVETQVVNPAVTSLSITSSQTPSVYGESLVATITVDQEAASLMAPVGQVQLYLDGVKFGTPLTLDSQGQATRTIPYLNIWPGVHELTATYIPAQPAQFLPSDNRFDPLEQVVEKASPLFIFESTPDSPVASQPVGFRVQVAPLMETQGTPTGTVQFFSDGEPIGSPVTLDDEGWAETPETVGFDAGEREITVSYSGDDYFLTVPTSTAFTQTVALASATVTIQSVNPLNAVVGQPVTVNVVVEPVASATETPAGTVTVSNGTDECTLTLDANGAGSCNLRSTSPTSGALTANFTSTGNFQAASSAPFSGLVIDKASSNVTITGFDPESVVVGQPISIQFAVVPVAPGWGEPSGQVTIRDDQGHSCTATVTEGACALTIERAGTVAFTAQYAGDNNFLADDQSGIGGTVLQAETTLALAAHPASVYGEPVYFTANLNVDAPGAGTPTGDVQFRINGTDWGDPVTLVNGVAESASISALAVGDHLISAVYLGDADFLTTTALALIHTVNKADTSLDLSSNQNPSPYGVPVLITAQLEGVGPSQAFPTSGTVQFIVDGVAYGAPVTVGTDGTASKLLPYTALWVGSHTITAVYSGDVRFNGSDNNATPLTQVVEKANLAIELNYSVDLPTYYGQSLSVQATVVGVGSNNPTPTGTVQFALDGIVQGSPMLLVNSAAASPLLTGLAMGEHTLRLSYSGDDYYQPYILDVPAAITVVKAPTSIQVTTISPANAVVGQPVTVSFTVSVDTPESGTPTGSVTLGDEGDTCTADLAEGNCIWYPTSIEPAILTATYSGDTQFEGSTVTGVAGPVVSKADVTLTMNPDSLPTDPIVVGQAYPVSVTVSPVAPGTMMPVGSVLTIGNGVDSCQATIQVDGTATCQLTPTTAAELDLIAMLGETSLFNSGQSLPIAGPTVEPSATSLGLVTSANPVVAGADVRFTARVLTNAPGSGVPTGSLQFQIDGIDFGEPVALTEGTATSPTITNLSVGDHAITARYLGNDDYLASDTSTAPLTQKVVEGSLGGEVTPEEGATFYYPGSHNGKPVTTTIEIPAGAVGEEITLVYHQLTESALTPPDGFHFVIPFTLTAYVDGEAQPAYTFNQPITVTLGYNPESWDEGSLDVLGWNGSQWSSEAIAVVEQDLETHTLTFTLSQLAVEQYTLVGEHQYLYLLPLIGR